MRFTRKSLATLDLPRGKSYAIFWDSELPGFGIRLNPTRKVWVVQYRVAGETRRDTLGRVEAISLEDARDSARRTLARVQLGADPRAEKAEAKAQRAITFGAVADRYLESVAERLKPRSYNEVSRHLLKHWESFRDLPMKGISRGLISVRLEEIAEHNGPIASNRARASLSALYSFALGLGLCDQNAVVGTIKPGLEIKRDHVLSDADLAAIWNACGVTEYGRIIKLLLLTGQRRDEVGGMLWSEISLETAIWTLPPSRTKNRRSHEVPLSASSIAVLSDTPRILGRDHVFGSGRFGFSGWSKAKLALDTPLSQVTTATTPWRVHDARRTVATGMANLGVPPHIIEAVLNHVSGAKAGVAGVYNRATYRDEKRDALNRWAEHVKRLVS